MTTLHLTNAYHASSGGIRTFYTQLLRAGNDQGRRVVLVVPGDADDVEDVGPFGRIYHLRSPRAPAFDRRYRLILPTAYAPLVRSRLACILEREQPALVEVSDKFSLPPVAAMLRKRWYPRVPRPVLVGLSCERFDDNMAAYAIDAPAARRFTQWYIRHVYGPPFDAHLAVSDYTAAELRSALWDRAPGFIRVCGMGVDVERFAPQRRSPLLRQQWAMRVGGDAGSALLVYAGRLSPEKNLPLLIETLRRLVDKGTRDYRLAVAGDGPMSAWVVAQAVGTLEGRIHWCGSLDRDALADLYASADVFIHPNPREPFGIAPLEAMASGLALVAPDRGGVRAYASPRNAWIARPTAPVFAEAVESALRPYARRLERARITAVEHAWGRVTHRLFGLYDQLAAAVPSRRAVVTDRAAATSVAGG